MRKLFLFVALSFSLVLFAQENEPTKTKTKKRPYHKSYLGFRFGYAPEYLNNIKNAGYNLSYYSLNSSYSEINTYNGKSFSYNSSYNSISNVSLRNIEFSLTYSYFLTRFFEFSFEPTLSTRVNASYRVSDKYSNITYFSTDNFYADEEYNVERKYNDKWFLQLPVLVNFNIINRFFILRPYLGFSNIIELGSNRINRNLFTPKIMLGLSFGFNLYKKRIRLVFDIKKYSNDFGVLSTSNGYVYPNSFPSVAPPVNYEIQNFTNYEANNFIGISLSYGIDKGFFRFKK